MINKMRNLVVAEEGQGMTEYGLVLGVIAIAVVGVLVTMRGKIVALFQNANTALDSAAGANNGIVAP
jgi:pilus assembly protein Flp/PilA